MFTKEEIDSWNEIFPTCTIKEADLTRPTEPFLTKTLTSYVRMLGYDAIPVQINQKADTDNLKERRLFLVKLARHIDHILKITDKSYTFTVYDLLHPTPKKTSHMLGILLNHMYYFSMYKKGVFEKAGDAIRKYDELLTQVKDAEEANKNEIAEAEQIKKEIELYSQKLPLVTSEITQLNAVESKQKEEKLQLEANISTENEKLKELNLERRNLKKAYVSEDEAKELQLQIQSLQQKVADYESQEKPIQQSLKECSEDIKLMENLLKGVTEVLEIVPHHQLNVLKDLNKQLKEMKQSYTAKRQKKQDLIMQIEKHEAETHTLQENQKILKKQFQMAQKSKQTEISKWESECKMLTEKCKAQQEELHNLHCLEKEQEDIAVYLKDNIENLMSSYKEVELIL